MLNNKTRANYGASALAAGSPDYGENDNRTDLVDCLANMMHYAESLGLDFTDAIESATMHFDAEVEEESEDALKLASV